MKQVPSARLSSEEFRLWSVRVVQGGKRRLGGSRSVLCLDHVILWLSVLTHGNQQTALVKAKFVEAIQNYQQVEQQYRQKYKQRMERQFKIGLFPLSTLVVVRLTEGLRSQ
jgi:hypothetical protein